MCAHVRIGEKILVSTPYTYMWFCVGVYIHVCACAGISYGVRLCLKWRVLRLCVYVFVHMFEVARFAATCVRIRAHFLK